MIVVKADKTNDLYRKGEIVTKLNKKGESRLRNTIKHSLFHLRRREGFESNPTYLQTIELYASLFGRKPSGY